MTSAPDGAAISEARGVGGSDCFLVACADNAPGSGKACITAAEVIVV